MTGTLDHAINADGVQKNLLSVMNLLSTSENITPLIIFAALFSAYLLDCSLRQQILQRLPKNFV